MAVQCCLHSYTKIYSDYFLSFVKLRQYVINHVINFTKLDVKEIDNDENKILVREILLILEEWLRYNIIK